MPKILIHINNFTPFHYFDIFSIEVLAHFNESKFVRFKNAYGEDSANKTLPGILETWRHVVAMRNPKQMFFYYLRFKNKFHFGTRFGYVKKHKPFITVFATIH